MYPFFHPTSVVVVDDDQDFLQSFSFRFGDNWLCETFASPNNALSFIKQRESVRQNLDRLLLPAEQLPDQIKSEGGESIFGFKTAHVDGILGDEGRFSQVSVAIIDYDMPSMTGFDLCRALKGIPMRKILLTGKVGLERAVEAFNESLIDCFLEKSDPNLSAELQNQVKRLQNDYFASTTEALRTLQAQGDGSFLTDPVFRLMFEKLAQRLGVVEYYATVHPSGVVLGLQDGQFSFLRISDDEDLRAHLEIAQINDAPVELLLRLEEGSDIPCFPTQTGFFEPSIRDSWRQYLFAAHVLPGQKTWHYAVINERQLPVNFLDNAVSYYEFRNKPLH